MRNHPNENEFDLHENGRAGETHLDVTGFVQRLVWTLRQKGTRKWLIPYTLSLQLVKPALVNHECLRCLSTVFSGPYHTFSFGRLANFPDWDRCKIYTRYWNWIEV